MLDATVSPATFGGLLGLRNGPGDQSGRGEDHLARVVGHLERSRRRGGGEHLLEVTVDEGRAPRGGELLDDRRQLVRDDLLEHVLVVQDPRQLGDLTTQPALLGLQFEPVEFGQPAQRRVENVGGLDVGQPELSHQAFLGGRHVVTTADQRDHLVDVEQRDQEAIHHMQPLLTLAAAELAAAGHHLVAMRQEHLEERLESQRLRLPVEQDQVVDAERLLQWREPVQVREQRLRVHPDLAFDDQPGAVLPVGQVLDVGDALQSRGLTWPFLGPAVIGLPRTSLVIASMTFSAPTP